MIVDDQKGIRRLLEEVFQQDGWQVRSLPDGQKAIQEVEEYCPDLVLMDVRMPNMNGLEAACRISELQPVAIIMMTAYGETEIIQKAMSVGVKKCITKPFDIAQLRELAAEYKP